MKVIGLTGGIGMGKSTAASIFRRAGIPVFDADAAVHRLQGRRGRAVRAIEGAFPDAVRGGLVDRAVLRRAIVNNPDALNALEQILHPLVGQEEAAFLARARRAGKPIVVLDIPLLLETGGDCRVDLVVVVSAPKAVQMNRVRLRRRMTSGEVKAMLARQMPDEEKRRRADVVVRTGLSRHHSYRSLMRLITELRRDPLSLARYRNHRAGAASRPSHHRSCRAGTGKRPSHRTALSDAG